MGCGCYDERNDNESGRNRRGKFNLNSSFNKNNGFNKKNANDHFDKISSINSSILDNSNIDINKFGKKHTSKDKKYNPNNKNAFNKELNINPKENIICNISWINFNNNEKQKFQIKISKSGSIQDLINLIQIEMEKLNQIKQHVFIYHKGIKVHEDETLYNLFQEKNEYIILLVGMIMLRIHQKI